MSAIDRLFGIFNADTWTNVLSSIGVKGRDRRRNTTVDVDPVTNEEARDLWRTDFLARACITKVPFEAFRPGFNVKIPDDKLMSEAVQGRLEELKITRRFVRAACFERAYGGAGMFPVLNDQMKALNTPLQMDRIVSVKAVHVFEPRELQVQSWYDQLTDGEYNRPKTYRLQPRSGRTASVEVHESRLIILPGIEVSNDQNVSDLPGWGDNALTVAKQTLADFGISLGSVAAMLDQFSQGVLSLNGLGEMLAQDAGKKVRDRLTMMDAAKSALRTLVIDKEDSFKRENVSFSGIPEVLRIWMYIVAAALDVPVALLFGMEPAGMNATGAFDMRSFYDRVHNIRTTQYQDPLERLISIVMLAKDGPTGGVEPEQWSTEWNPLWQMSDKEREDARKVRTENDVALIDAGIASPDEIREQRYGGDTYSYELQLVGPAPVPEVDPAHVAQLEASNAKAAGKRPGGLRGIAQAVLEEPDDEPDEEIAA